MFITFEGGEGGGKSTLVRKIAEALQPRFTVCITREPGGTKLGESIRSLLLHGEKVDAKAELFLFLAARIQHVEEVIKPALQRGEIVLCDRFSDSTIAYQGGGRALGVEYVQACTRQAIGDFQPDLTFYIDVPPEVGLQRAGRRSGHDRIEKEALQFHEEVRRAFCFLAKDEPNRIQLLDGTKSRDEVLKDALEVLFERL